VQIVKVQLGGLEDAPSPRPIHRQQATPVLQAAMRASGNGAEQVEIGQQRLGGRDLGAELRLRGLLREPQDKQGVGQHQLARGVRPGEVVLIEATNLARRQAMRRNRRREADAVVRFGARQRHQVLHRRVRHDAAIADVLLNRVGERADQAEAPRHPAHTPIEAPRDDVEREPVLLVQRAQQPRLLEDVLGRIGLEQMAKDQGVAGGHLPHDRHHRVPVQPV
jgi:hypothetical protein